MIVKPIKTRLVKPGQIKLAEFLDQSLSSMPEKSVLAVTSKVVSLCEGRVIPRSKINKAELVRQEADRYMPAELSRYGYQLTITHDTLIAMSGIDESNGGGDYILWPADPQQTANEIRGYLATRFNLRQVAVIIVDSTCTPLRYGTTGIALCHSGFRALNDYVGQLDLFGKPFAVSQANIAGGLAASAVLAMGEGAEQTPLALMTDLPFVEFQPRDPTAKELASLRVPLAEDLFAPFLNAITWHSSQ